MLKIWKSGKVHKIFQLNSQQQLTTKWPIIQYNNCAQINICHISIMHYKNVPSHGIHCGWVKAVKILVNASHAQTGWWWGQKMVTKAQELKFLTPPPTIYYSTKQKYMPTWCYAKWTFWMEHYYTRLMPNIPVQSG